MTGKEDEDKVEEKIGVDGEIKGYEKVGGDRGKGGD